MSLCRRVQCAVCEVISRLRPWAYAGIAGLPLAATGCGGVMHAANAELLALNEYDDEAAEADASPFGDGPRQRYVPQLLAAENAPGEDSERDVVHGEQQTGPDGSLEADEKAGTAVSATNNDPGALAALENIGLSGNASPPAAAGMRDRATTARTAKRPPRPAPTGPVSIFGADTKPITSPIARTPAGPTGRGVVSLTAAQEEIPADDHNGVGHNFEPSDTMTVEQIVNYAAMRHPQLDTLREEIRVAEAALIEASLFTNPSFRIDTDVPHQEGRPAELSFQMMFTIPTAWKRSYAQRAADAGIRTAQLGVSRETQIIVDEAIAAAMEVVWLQELMELQGELQVLANELVERTAGGVISKSEHVNAKVNQSDVDLQRIKTAAALQTARMRLSKAMGLNPPRALRVRARLPELPAPKISLETLFAAVRDNRPEIAEARAAIAQSRRERDLEMANAVPDIEVGPRFSDEFRDTGDSMGARVQFDLPIFNRNQGAIAEADANMRVNQATLRATEMVTLNDVAAAYAELEPMQLRLEYYRDKVPVLAAEAQEAIKGAFETGMIDSNKMVNEQQRLGKLKIEHLNLRYQYNRLRARIELYAGRSLEQLAAIEQQMQAEAARKAATQKAALPDASAPEHATPDDANPKSAPKSAPKLPGAKKPEVDSRVARATRTGSRAAGSAINDPNVTPTSSTGAPKISQKSASVSPLEYAKNLVTRKPTTPEELPYGNAKPATGAKR